MRIEELVDRMLRGEADATREVGRRLQVGDPEAVRELGERLSRAGGKKVGEAAPPEDPAEFQADLRKLADVLTSKPCDAEPRLAALEMRARRLGRCEGAQILGLTARYLTLTGQLRAAREAISRAKEEATGCRACELDAMRREALLLVHLGSSEEALRTSQAAMDGYEVFGSPGHDLYGNGWASSLVARGQIRFELGDKAGAAADFAHALGQFARGSKAWMVTHQNFASSLALTGPSGLRQVNAELAALRMSMRRGGATVERACFLWLDGQLVIAADPRRRSRGLDRLEESLKIFRCVRMPGSWLGVASDYARALFPDRDAIGKFLRLKVQAHADGFLTAGEHERQLGELLALCTERRLLPASALRRAIEHLREVAGVTMPCLVPWPDRAW